MFVVKIETENAAFEPEDRRDEIARILRELAARIMTGEATPIVLLDVNGNTVGSATTEIKEIKEVTE